MLGVPLSFEEILRQASENCPLCAAENGVMVLVYLDGYIVNGA
jgi:hypothetical protein